jgi:hypothetical protein
MCGPGSGRNRRRAAGVYAPQPPAIPTAPLHLAAELLEECLVDLVSDDLLSAEFAENTETARILSFNKQKKTAAKK